MFFSLVKDILIYFSLIVKQAICAYVNHARICSWNSPVLSNLRKTQFQTFLLYRYCRNTYPKGRALMKMYIVVPQTKRGNSCLRTIYVQLHCFV